MLSAACCWQVGRICATREACSGRGDKEILYFTDKEEMTKELLSLVEEGDILWFKASRGMKLEEVLSRLYERF